MAIAQGGIFCFVFSFERMTAPFSPGRVQQGGPGTHSVTDLFIVYTPRRNLYTLSYLSFSENIIKQKIW